MWSDHDPKHYLKFFLKLLLLNWDCSLLTIFIDLIKFLIKFNIKKFFKFGKLKFKIKNHRIRTKTEFSGLKIDLIRKKNLEQFRPKFRLIKYQRVSLLVMTILCKTKLFFVAAALIIKNLLFTFLILISPYVWKYYQNLYNILRNLSSYFIIETILANL